MLSRNPSTTTRLRSLELRIADTNVRIEAPETVLSVLEATLSFVPGFDASGVAHIVTSVEANGDVWEIRGTGGSLKVLGANSALPQVAGAVVTSVINDLAAELELGTMRACVLQKDGLALAMIGDDWESALTVAAHLHGRGWTFLGSDNVLINPQTLDVHPLQKSLYVNASSVGQFPMEYRRAVEASPWYVTGQGISFYAVDPRTAGHLQTWAPAAKLHGVVVVDGAMVDRPSVESLERRHLDGDRFTRLGIDWQRVSVVDLRMGSYPDTCDIIEHWFESIAK